MAEFLLDRDYEVHGIKRRASSFNTERIDHIFDNTNLTLHYGDLSDSSNLTRLISDVRPDEVYNLGAQSHVSVSFESPEYTADVDALGTLRLLEAIRFRDWSPKLGSTKPRRQSFTDLCRRLRSARALHLPRSPYAIAKLYAYWITVNYREAYGLYACNGILFNHESPRRGETLANAQITRGLANISQGLEACLHVGNLDALRDWGHAKDYVRMQWLMLQQEQPEDFVIATGKQYSIRDFITWTASALGLEVEFKAMVSMRFAWWSAKLDRTPPVLVLVTLL